MPCLHTYWLKQFFKFFFIIQLTILVLFVFIDYLSRMDKFMKTDITLIGGLGYVLLKAPFMFVQFTPAGVLLASIIVFGLMNNDNELLAVQSSGVSVYFLMKPAVLAAALLAGLMFFMGETLIPVSMTKANFIRYNILKKNNNYLSVRKDIWIRSDNRLIHINHYDPLKQAVSGVTISTMGEGFFLESRLDAEKGVYQNGEWVFENIVDQTYIKDELDYQVQKTDRKSIRLALEPDDLGQAAVTSDEMGFFELKRYVNKLKREGYDATRFRVDMQAKVAFPFICIIMVLIGSVMGMRRFVRHNIPVAVGAGVGVAFLYWVMYGFCLSLGYGGVLPTLVSAWAANLFFVCFTVLFLVVTETA